MKHELIMENWRKFVTETEQTKNYGDLYLFEEDTIKKVSFYNRLMSLNEGENDLDIFVEQWEKSANHELDRLDEIDWKALKSNPVIYLSTQVYALIGRAKDKVLKYVGKIKAVLNRAGGLLDRFKERNPKLYKVGALAIKVAIAMVAVAGLNALFGGDTAMAGDLTGYVSPAEAAQGVSTGDVIANAEQLEAIGQMLQQSGAETHQQLGAELVELAQSADNMSARELSDKFQGLSTIKLESFIESGVEQLAQVDANAAEAAEQAMDAVGDAAPQAGQDDRVNAPMSAIHSLGQLAQGNEDAVQKLIDLQDAAGAPDAIKGVDFESLSKEEVHDLIDQIREEADIDAPDQPDLEDSGQGSERAISLKKAGDKLKTARDTLGQKFGQR